MRYERQLIINQIGEAGQKLLKQSKVVVIGAGGLASPVLTYLTCAGIGSITLVDYDVVSESNLNRQFLYGERDIGNPKVQLASEFLNNINSTIEFYQVSAKLEEHNIKKVIEGADVVIDCVDNIETRLTVNRGCLQMNIPLVEGGVNGFYGFLLAIKKDFPCLECLGYGNTILKRPGPALGAVAGVIGSLQAVECLKILLGLDGILYGSMLNYDGISATFETVKIQKNNMCHAHSLCK